MPAAETDVFSYRAPREVIPHVRGSRTIRLFQCAASATTVAAALIACVFAQPASAEIARPPGANPSGRGYELVSLPDAGGFQMFLGTSESEETLFRRPPVAAAGGEAMVSSLFPLPGQLDRGGISLFRSVRQPSGVWTQTDATGAAPATPRDGSPVAWSPDFATVLWNTDEPRGLKVLSDDGSTLTFIKNSAADPNNDPPMIGVFQRAADGSVREVSLDESDAPVPNPTLNGVSPDGSRVAFSSDDGSGSGPRIFLRDGGESVAVDTPRQTLAAPRTTSRFVGSSTDLGTIFFITRDRLLAGDTDDDADLYRWTKAGNDLQLISRGTGAGGNGSGQGSACPASLQTTQLEEDGGARGQGCDVLYLRSSSDGDVTYFVSPERLDGAPGAQPGDSNLYVRRGQGPITFVLTFVAARNADIVTEPDGALLASLSARPNPNADVTSDVAGDGALLLNARRNPETGAVYDALQVLRIDPDTGASTCMSCGADGSSTAESALSRAPGNSSRPRDNATADGRHVFFETSARLVTADRNSVTDVYDYDVATGERSLVSPGTSANPSFFSGVSSDGADVMFLTPDALVGRDQNGEALKVYDARRGGGEETPTASTAPCGDACEPAGSSPPPFEIPPSGLPGASEGNVRTQTSAVRLVLGSVSAAQRRSLVRTGKATLRVRTSAAAIVRVTGRAKLGRSTSTVASGSVRLSKAGTKSLSIRLSAAARRALKSKGSLKVSFAAVVAGGSAKKTVSVSLRATTNKRAGAR